MSSPAPRYRHFSVAAVETLLGRGLHDRVEERCGEIAIHVGRDGLVELLRDLRDTHEYQQLMEIVGVDYPERSERFEVVYCLLSLSQNHRVRVHVTTDEDTPVPSATGLWPNAGWLEREVFDMYGVTFAGNADLRRILTDYGFEGYPLRKDFPQTGYVELRYSEAEKRVIYEPVELPQDFRNFDFLMPWEGTDYKLPGDEKAATPPPAPAAAPTPKVTEKPSDTGAGKGAEKEANKAAKKPVAKKAAAPKAAKKAEPKRTPRKPKGKA